MTEYGPPVLGFAGFSGSGKTMLLCQLISRCKANGLRVGVIKHAHHEFEIDHPGKDSYELRHAGAARIAVGSSRRWALIVERPSPREPTLAEMLALMTDDSLDLALDLALDLVFVEGFRHERYPKIEVHRPALGHALLAADDDSIIAIATDDADLDTRGLPRLDLNDSAAIETFVIDYLARSRRPEVHR